jgi:NAD(P)-dependent dehydrogenase (short-subunit alcohol dehydrogenase family)
MKNFGRVDIVICNAGILRDKTFLKMSDEDWELIMRIHLRAVYSLTSAVFPIMRTQNYGRIVCVSSASGLYGNIGQANYSAAKLAVVGLAQTLAKEGASKNINVNVIAPLAGSRMTETIMPPELVAALKPEYVAAVVACLVHEDSKTTGDNNNGRFWFVFLNICVSGAVYEAGAGWVAGVRRERCEGLTLSGGDALSPEVLQQRLHEARRFVSSSTPSSPADSTAAIISHLNKQKARL